MILHAEQGFRGRVVDLDTGRLVHKVIWLDTEKGELEAYQLTSEGDYILDGYGNYLTFRAKGNFKFTYNPQPQSASVTRVVMGAPKCAKCSSPLVLQGDDLCPACKARDRGQRNKMIVERITNPLQASPCQHKGCGRTATYSVADEVIVTPQLHAKYLWERGATVGRRFYCAFHFQPPRLLDDKGEVVEVLEAADGVRPQ